VVGIWAPGAPAARLAYVGLHALQHRGQESAGIAVTDGGQLSLHKRIGLVSSVFDEETLARLEGREEGGRPPKAAIGHTRYSTTGSNTLPNVPMNTSLVSFIFFCWFPEGVWKPSWC
jgi:amidophosphoribosyltransferase